MIMKKTTLALLAAFLVLPALAGNHLGVKQFTVSLQMPQEAACKKVRVEHSADLVHWKTVKVARADKSGRVQVIDHSTKQASKRFYRAVTLH